MLSAELEPVIASACASTPVVDDALSPDFPLGVEPRGCSSIVEDAERFIDEVRGDDPELAATLRVEERELEAGGLN